MTRRTSEYIKAAIFLLIAFALMMLHADRVSAQPVCVSSECEGDPHHSHAPRHKSDKRWVVPAVVIGLGAGVAGTVWWLGRSKEPPPEPPKAAEPQERILTITPDIKVYQ